jgi:hypothetical protein
MFWKTSEIKKLKLNPDGGIFVLVESLIKFRKMGLKIGEASSPYRPRYAGASKTTELKPIFKMLKTIIQFKWELLTGNQI